MSTLYKVGFVATDTPGNLKTLTGTTTGAGNYVVMKNGGSNFQVNASKTLYIGRISVVSTSGTCTHGIYYGTSAINDAAGPPAGNTVVGDAAWLQGGANITVQFDVLLVIPSSQYPHFRSSEAVVSTGMAYAVEV
jgi:hypothetical protein